MNNETPTELCQICGFTQAVLFAVMRQGDIVEKAHICNLCFSALNLFNDFTTEKVPFREFQATFTTGQLQVN